MSIPQVPYDRELLIEAIKSGAETIIEKAESIIPANTMGLKGLTVAIEIKPDEVAAVSVNYVMDTIGYVFPYRNHIGDALSLKRKKREEVDDEA